MTTDSFLLAAVFSNHCVLQRDKIICIFGYGKNGSLITVSLKNKRKTVLSKNAASVKDGRWEVYLEPQEAQTGCSLLVECSGSENVSKELTDICIGEVWIAGGQSNMEFELQNCAEGPIELVREKHSEVRFYYTNKIAWKDEAFYEAEKNTCWQTWESEGKRAWSAVGYFFAKKLALELGVTVGVIGCNWGGTSASCWMDKKYMSCHPELNTYLQEYEEETKGKSEEQQCKEYEQYEIDFNKWQEKYSEELRKTPGLTWEQAEKILGKNPYPGPKSCKSPMRPSGLYDTMLKRIMPYTVKGVIWYQGESDTHKPKSYFNLFANLIENWRNDWKDPLLPFVFVQLPGNRYKYDQDHKDWCILRECQEKTANQINNAFITRAAELGDFSDIHPKAKKEVAERMTKVALCHVYKLLEEEKADGPSFLSAIPDGNQIKLYFNNAQDGLVYKEDKQVFKNYKELESLINQEVPADFSPFEVAGKDGIYHYAQFELGQGKEKNCVKLKSPLVEEPVSARYAWYNYGPVVIFGKNGLPLATFRTSITD
ncbi:MAG: sialate O-acetylesterase [Treponema sp.]|nr:sialate O-acetylesterase [Treponema sp.]